MVAERGEGGGRSGGGSSSGRRRRRRRVSALVAPTEGGGHRDPGAADRDGRKTDERAKASFSSPRRSRDVLEGDRQEWAAAPRCAPVARHGSERGAKLRSRHQPLKMAAPESHRHHPARTAQARSAGAYQALQSPGWGEYTMEPCAPGNKAQR